MIGRSVCCALFAMLASGCSSHSVVRVIDGHEVPGRFVSYQAYAEYARGALLEAQGDLEGANSAYGRALAADSDSVELWTRLFALRCRLKRGDAEQAFQQALSLDRNYAPLWREQAQCHLLSGKPGKALEAALRAAKLDPNQAATTLLVASLYEQQNKLSDARRWLDALVAREPDSIVAQRAKLDLALRHSDMTRARQASQDLLRLNAESLRVPPLKELLRRGIDVAFVEENLSRARELARRIGMSPGELALVAITLGKPQLALAQADWVLGADRDNGDAWVAGLCAADLLQNSQRFTEILELSGTEPVSPGPLGTRLFGELLQRRVGEGAAQAWLTAAGAGLRADADAGSD